MKAMFALLLAITSMITFAQKPAFEVVSVKPDPSPSSGGTVGVRNDGFYATNVPVRAIVSYAYAPATGRFLDAQIISGPDWMNTDRFDVEARMSKPATQIP